MFHDIKGKNIAFDRNRYSACWCPVQTGGLAFTRNPLCHGESLTLTLEGTGGVELGIVSKDPATWVNRVPVSMNGIDGYQFLNDIKIHKRTCTITIAIDLSLKEVTSSYGGGQYIQKIENRQYWLVADVKYGLVECKLDNQGNENNRHYFSKVQGNNMQLLNDPTVVKTYTKSPASICFYHQPVQTGLKLSLQCSPKAHQGTTPGRYYILLRYTTLSPDQLKKDFLHKFDISRKIGPEPPWIEVEKFEKEDCIGGPILLEFSGHSLKYISSSGKHNQQNCNTDSAVDDIWLVMELYGVTVTLEDITERAGAAFTDAVDSFGQGSMRTKNFPKKLSSSNLSVEGAGIEQPRRTLIFSDPDSSFGDAPVEDLPIIDEGVVDMSSSIQANWTNLLEGFTVSGFVDMMFEKKIITMEELNTVLHLLKESNKSATREVLRILSFRPISKKFMELALDKTAQTYLLNKFFPDTTEKE